jgi:hypothetical protein
VPGRGLHRIFTKIRTFAISASFWTRAEEHLHVFDAPWTRQSTPSARPRAPRVAPSRARALPAHVPIKQTKASAIRPHALSTSLEHEITGVCPAHSVPADVRTPTTVDRPTEPSPAPSDPRERLCMPRWSSQSKESRSASPETPD